MKKLRIFHSFATPYHLRQSDKLFAKNCENTFRPEFHHFSNYFYIIQNQKKQYIYGRCGFSPPFQRHLICSIPTNRLKIESKIRFTFLVLKKMVFSKLLLNHNDFAKTFNILEIWLSRAFQRYITRPRQKNYKKFLN